MPLYQKGGETIKTSRGFITKLIPTFVFAFFLLVPSAEATTCQVRTGDTLYLISQKYNTTVTALKMVNHLSSDLIYSGQSLVIPTIYQVKAGESWYLIGKSFGVSVDQLKMANEKWDDYLIAGQTISIPKSGGNSASPPSSRGSQYTREEITLLSRVICGEARGESYTGQVAVGAVVLNRVKSSKFPNSISGVVYQPGAFTAVDDGQIWLPITESAKKAALDAINGWDPSNGALYYYNPATATNQWIRSRPIVARIGNHVFCK